MAERSLRLLQVEIDEGKVGLRQKAASDVVFDEWAADYLTFLADKRRKQTTIRAYEITIGYAQAAFGGILLDQIGNPELREFTRRIRGEDDKGSDATLSKHLRHLSASSRPLWRTN